MLKLKKIPVFHAVYPLIYIHENCPDMQVRGLKSNIKVQLHGALQPFYGTLVVTSSDKIVQPDEIGVSQPSFADLNMPEGSLLSLFPAPCPSSVDSIRRKMAGDILTYKEQENIVADIATNAYSDLEIAGFLVANASFYSPQEVLSLTMALLQTFRSFPLKKKEELIVDSYSVGGLLGNRTDPIVLAIILAAGMMMPKFSNYAVTSYSSTVDVMSTFCAVDLSEDEIRRVIDANNGCLVSSANFRFSVANNRLIGVERGLGINTFPQIVSSTLAARKALGVTHVLVDIPVGPFCKVKTMPEALHLKKLFEYVADSLGLVLNIALTDGTEPVGNGIGPVLEARDVMNVLRCSPEAPEDLKEKSLFIAGRILEFNAAVKGGEGYHRAMDLLTTGKALEAFTKIIFDQGKVSAEALSPLCRDILAPKDGIVGGFNAAHLHKIALATGAPRDKGSGLDLLVKSGEEVQAGDILYRIYAQNSNSFAFANGLAEGDIGVTILPQ